MHWAYKCGHSLGGGYESNYLPRRGIQTPPPPKETLHYYTILCHRVVVYNVSRLFPIMNVTNIQLEKRG